MKEKSIIVIVITVVFIIATGILYCVNTSKVKSEDMFLTDEVSSEATSNGNNSIDKNTSDKIEHADNKNDSNELEEQGSRETENQETEICVHICGQVKKPGVYLVNDSDRVADLIKQAGGLLKDAAPDAVNQAQHVVDGQQIYIPSKDEVVKGTSPTSMKVESTLVNINTANMEELMTLPGIGESKAKSIIKYREENQGFQSIDEIKKIEGIKDGVFRKIQDFISIS